MRGTYVCHHSYSDLGRSVGCEDPLFSGRVNGGASSCHIELHQDRRDMVLHGAERDEESVGDLVVSETFCKEFEDFCLPSGQTGGMRSGHPASATGHCQALVS